MANEDRKRVAIVGASGIGKFHGQWWSLEGAEVCAFAGTTKASVERTAPILRGLFSFEGRGYTSIESMLEEAAPDIVDVCSPPGHHYAHARAALEQGCHVLCEKPFVYEEGAAREALLDQGRELQQLAQARGRKLAVCTQYAAAARIIEALWLSLRGGDAVTYFKGHLQVPVGGRDPNPRDTWIDLAPHLLSALFHFAPDGILDWNSLDTHFEGHGARALFTVIQKDRPPIQCDLVTRRTNEEPTHVRYFQLNECPFNIETEPGVDGTLSARIELPDRAYTKPDMMRLLIRDFLAGTPTTSVKDSLVHLDILLRILEASGMA